MGNRDNKAARCESCGKVLRGIDRCGGRIDVCARRACFDKAASSHGGRRRIVAANTIRCAWPDCGNFVPAGIYDERATSIACCQHCYEECKRKHTVYECAYVKCRRQFRGTRSQKEHPFCCREHCTLQGREEFLDRTCGKFRPLLEEYVDVAKHRLRCMESVRAGLALLFLFMNERGINDIDDVKPPTITAFLRWGDSEGHPSVWNALWPISTFMKWLYTTGRRKSPSPVVARFHSRKKPKRLPRPYTEEEMKRIWQLLNSRGTPVTRLAVAIAEESGLRIGEIANLRVQDMDLARQRLFVRLPNKAMTEAFVPFHKKTRKYLKKWLLERDSSVGHDYLLYNEYGRPFHRNALHHTLCRVLCKTARGKKVNDDGLDSWSTHRLRHVMASRLARGGANAAAIMALGRWATYSTMCGYAGVDEETKVDSLHRAMERAKKLRDEKPARLTSAFHKGLNGPDLQAKAG